ncbi:diacylglycerol kinase family protein [Weeksellaceae bacterium KMM 9713]|uniref:Diacylglycerol kinase family protein n=1 Tax=Profundicola chukchiensis TaxID=2961959 RepID=A0A9X4RW36_9FLAO|nr:diacylglycerol kinase family protein [Profundicola chukchiensis]MDG4946530.1 diacylglycerol kinase family protein [Profundicola chukchiensis]
MKARLKSFGYALNGIREVIKSEMNMRIHLAASFLVIIMGLIFSINWIEWIFIIICIALVLSAEIANTVVEKYLDAMHPEFNPKVGLIKDMAAAAVLILAMSSFIIGMIIFLPKIIDLLT